MPLFFLTACGGGNKNESSIEPDSAREVPVVDESPVLGDDSVNGDYEVVFHPHGSLKLSSLSVKHDDIISKAERICLYVDYKFSSCNAVIDSNLHEPFNLLLSEGDHKVYTVLKDYKGYEVGRSFSKTISVSFDSEYELGKNFPSNSYEVYTGLLYDYFEENPNEVFLITDSAYKRGVTINGSSDQEIDIKTTIFVGGAEINQVCLGFESIPTLCYDVSDYDFESLLMTGENIDLRDFDEVEMVTFTPEDGSCFLDSYENIFLWKRSDGYEYDFNIKYYCPNTGDKVFNYTVDIYIDGSLVSQKTYEITRDSFENYIFPSYYRQGSSESLTFNVKINSVYDLDGARFLVPDKSEFEASYQTEEDQINDLLDDLLDGLTD
ncbi:MAG: hypothetical protein P1U46_04190 [Patescibacteria group bacterium]|nr:hypothetical protein [Patescibacteria group bacterium]